MKKAILSICLLFVAAFAFADGYTINGIINKYKNTNGADYMVISVEKEDYKDMAKFMELEEEFSPEMMGLLVEMAFEAMGEEMGAGFDGIKIFKLLDLEQSGSAAKKSFTSDVRNLNLKDSFELILNEDNVMVYVSSGGGFAYSEMIIISADKEEPGIMYIKGTSKSLESLMQVMMEQMM